ncbi:hypothetical protein HOK51_08495 [Candidatus Woesearchaeota archaeon]|jgi:hypothetical protein|nr:hypothetical protein [Candidatus Woesearchaeota archaeon]MBT6519865.1 hypothetical protein [Candidatus Woesearchaeota archaeon]MBT7367157.1 hypothetical protein [Candidatus Woesearchaeota archaeon]
MYRLSIFRTIWEVPGVKDKVFSSKTTAKRYATQNGFESDVTTSAVFTRGYSELRLKENEKNISEIPTGLEVRGLVVKATTKCEEKKVLGFYASHDDVSISEREFHINCESKVLPILGTDYAALNVDESNIAKFPQRRVHSISGTKQTLEETCRV